MAPDDPVVGRLAPTRIEVRGAGGMSVMDDLRRNPESDISTEGYVVEIVDGRVIMTPQGPDQDDTVFEIRSQVRDRHGKDLKTASDVLVDFPGGTWLAPDVTLLAPDAVRHGNRYVCTDVLAVIEFVSLKGDPNDYITKVEKYGRFGITSYLIVDPFTATCTLLEDPQPTGYGKRTEIPFAETVRLPLADGRVVELDTSSFPVIR
ncbi:MULTISPECIES: Uma2 family endonuclease [unclassified Streptomyces]|uniref:Uma2 family endonuclease n=1 Tax=unclassified Streptomyces TaxID=2593676 RepID=UPI0022B65645|nr:MULTISPECIES: Uma2 family endonuclease [unclassified Streptomyces]MCZ7417184.1 Uma2 family endonuclease [Streptomyces sp. WMMC897]MCZ7432987.1 Uma2 family endonuclease [Streptomyces sp. WMMC1477]